MKQQQKKTSASMTVRMTRPQPAVTVAAVATPRRRPLLPVLGPFAGLLILTGCWRAGEMLFSLSSGTQSAYTAKQAAIITPGKNPTEKAVAGYTRAARLAQAGDDAAALAALDGLDREPLVVDGGTFTSKELASSSASIHLMRASAAFAARARSAATAGDAETAGRWLDACRSLSAHVARAEQPTIEALTVLHYVDEQAAKARLAVLDVAPGGGGPLRGMLEQQRVAINSFWRDTVLAEMRRTWEERQSRPGGTVTAADPAVVSEERALASRLMTRYLAEQARLQGMAASGVALVPPSA